MSTASTSTASTSTGSTSTTSPSSAPSSSSTSDARGSGPQGEASKEDADDGNEGKGGAKAQRNGAERANERAKERANASSPVATVLSAEAVAPSATPATSGSTPGTPIAPETPSAPAATPIADSGSASDTSPTAGPLQPLLAGDPVTPAPVADAAPTTIVALGPADADPAPSEAAGAVELPIQLPDRPQAVDRDLVGRSALDALLGTDGRSFHVPVVLLLALGGYLSVQRRLGRGPLPMASSELPASVLAWRGQGDDDVRYFL
jgi:hypothetical protein